MKKDWLKDSLGERFEDFDSGLDLEQAWQDLEKRRKPQKKDRKFIIFWIGVAIIGIALLGFYLINTPAKSNNVALKAQKNIIQQENAKKEGKEKKERNGMVVQELNESKTENQELFLEIDQSNKTNVAKYNIEAKGKVTTENSSGLVENISSARKRHEHELNSDPHSDTTNPSDLLLQNLIPINSRTTVKNNKKSTLRIGIISLLPTFMNQSINREARDLITMDAIPMKLSKAPIPIEKISRNSFGISFAYGLHNRKLDILDADRMDFVSAKKNQEKALDAIAVSLFYRKYFADDYFAEIGLGYQQTTYEFKDQTTSVEKQFLDDQIIAIHNYPDGSEESILGTLEQTETRVRNNIFYQKFRQIHLNVIIGKELDLSPSIGLGISGGLEYGLFSQAKGVTFSNTLDFRNYGELSELKYKENGILSGLVRIELLKALNARNELGIAMIGKSSVGNLFDSNQFIEKRKYLMSRISYTHRF